MSVDQIPPANDRDPRLNLTTCRSCDARVFFAITPNAKRMILDAEPSPNGTVSVQWRRGDVLPLARVLKTAERFGRTNLHLDHHASCPDANSWRKRGRS